MKAVYKFEVPMGFKLHDCNHCQLWHQYSMGVGCCGISKYLHTPFGQEHQCPLDIELESDDYVSCIQCKWFESDKNTFECAFSDKCCTEDPEDELSMLDERPYFEPKD